VIVPVFIIPQAKRSGTLPSAGFDLRSPPLSPSSRAKRSDLPFILLIAPVFIIPATKRSETRPRTEIKLQFFCSGKRLPVHFSIRLRICFFLTEAGWWVLLMAGTRGAMGVKLTYQIFV